MNRWGRGGRRHGLRRQECSSRRGSLSNAGKHGLLNRKDAVLSGHYCEPDRVAFTLRSQGEFDLLFLAFKGGGWAAGILGVITLIFGGILVANWSVPGWGLALIWVAAVFAFFGGFFLIYMAFKQRKA